MIFIWNFNLDKLLMIPLSILYDECIDRPKLTEEKKNSWAYSSSPAKVGRNNYSP